MGVTISSELAAGGGASALINSALVFASRLTLPFADRAVGIGKRYRDDVEALKGRHSRRGLPRRPIR